MWSTPDIASASQQELGNWGSLPKQTIRIPSNRKNGISCRAF
jgi:hypothetical protein